MIDIYATYTKDNPGRIKIQSVPAGSESGIRILNPIVKGDIGNATSMDFSVQNGTPYFGQFLQMRTYITVDYDGDTIFYGRVITINNDFYGGEKIHCEGALAFLNDSFFPGEKSGNKKTQTTLERISEVLENHNAQVNELLKSVYVGEVPGNYTARTAPEQRIKSESREFGQTSWNNSKSALEDLKSHYGGAFRIRYEAGLCYLDWLNHYFRSEVRDQKIEIGKNLIDVTRATELSNIFTAIIPIGKTSSGDNAIYLDGYRTNIHGNTNYITVPQIRKSAFPAGVDTSGLYTDGELDSGYHKPDDYRLAVERYGMVFKTVEFQEAHTQAELFAKAVEWIKDNYQGGVTTFSVKAIDLHLAGERVDKILLGDRVPLKYPVGNNSTLSRIEERVLTCTSAQYDLFNPENNQYTFGIPANMLGKTYGDNSQKKKKSSSPSGGKDDDGEPGPEDEYLKWAEAVKIRLKSLKFWKKTNGGVVDGPTGTFDTTPMHGYYLQMLKSSDANGNHNYCLTRPLSPVVKHGYKEGGLKSWYEWPAGQDGRSSYSRAHIFGSVYNDAKQLMKQLEAAKLFDFIYYEHGIDLRKDASGGSSETPISMPPLTTDEDGNISITALNDNLETAAQTILKTIGAEEGASVLEIFNSGGFPVGKILLENGAFEYIQLDEQGHPVEDPDHPGEYLYVNVKDIKRSTQELTTELESLGHSVTLIDDQVTIIGQTVSDPVTGLVKKVADQGNTITLISTDLIQLGSYMSQEMADFTARLTSLGNTVTNISTDVINLGQHVDEETQALTEELAAQGLTVTNITTDVTNITSEVVNVKGTIRGHAARLDTIEADYATIAYLSAKHNMAAGNISARHFYIDTGVDSEMGSYDLNNSVGSAKITLSGNTYTLHLYRLTGGELTPPSGYNMTFSRATTLSPSWAGSGKSSFPLTITASPQGNTYSIGFSSGANLRFRLEKGAAASKDSGKYVKQEIVVQQDTGTSTSPWADRYGVTIYGINASSIYDDGWTAAAGKVAFPTTNTSSNLFTFTAPSLTVDSSTNRVGEYRIYQSGVSDGANAYVYVKGGANSIEIARLGIGQYYTAGQNSIINAGGAITQTSNVTNKAINKYVTTLTVNVTSGSGYPTFNAEGRQSDTNASAVAAFCQGATSVFATTSYHVSNGYWYKFKIAGTGVDTRYFVFHAYA